jgi:hypothetical protein
VVYRGLWINSNHVRTAKVVMSHNVKFVTMNENEKHIIVRNIFGNGLKNKVSVTA